MKKLLSISGISMLLGILLPNFSQSQTVNTEFASQMNSVFSNLDKSRIPHDLLTDYGMEFTELTAYGGALTNDNFVLKGTLTEIYNTLLMSKTKANVTGLTDPVSFKGNWDNLRLPIRYYLLHS